MDQSDFKYLKASQVYLEKTLNIIKFIICNAQLLLSMVSFKSYFRTGSFLTAYQVNSQDKINLFTVFPHPLLDVRLLVPANKITLNSC